MAAKSKAKKKASRSKAPVRAKSTKPAAKSAPRGSGGDESSEVLRASAKSFAARLLR